MTDTNKRLAGPLDWRDAPDEWDWLAQD